MWLVSIMLPSESLLIKVVLVLYRSIFISPAVLAMEWTSEHINYRSSYDSSL